MSPFTEISRDHQKYFLYERRAYESVDEKSLKKNLVHKGLMILCTYLYRFCTLHLLSFELLVIIFFVGNIFLLLHLF